MSHVLRAGVADQIAYFRAYDTDGTAKVDLTSSTTGLSISVFRVGASSVSVASLSNKTADDTTHADGAIRPVAGNLYTIDLPDAACASQVPSVVVRGSYTGGVIEGLEHPIVAYDPSTAYQQQLWSSSSATVNLSGTTVKAVTDRVTANTDQWNGTSVSSATVRSDLINIAGVAVSTSTAQLGVNVVNAAGTAWASGAITAASIASNAITSAKIASSAIGATQIASNAITSAKIAADTIGATQIATGAITSAKFASGAITSTVIAADAIGSSQLAASAITSSELDATAISAIQSGLATTTAVSDISDRIPTALEGGFMMASVQGMGANTLTASAIASDAVSEIQSGLATSTALTTVEGKVDIIDTNVDTLLSRITSTLFSGITYLSRWLGAIAGKTADTTTRAEINATTAGAGYNETTDSQEAIRDRGDAAWTSGEGGGSVNVAPLQATAPNRVAGTEIVTYINDTSAIGPIAITDADGDAVDLSGYTLKVCIEKISDGTILANITPSVSGTGSNQITFTPTSDCVSTTKPAAWSLRSTSNGEVLGYGPFTVESAARLS